MTLHVAIFLQNYYVENIIEKLKNLSLVHNDLIKVLDLFQNIYVGSYTYMHLVMRADDQADTIYLFYFLNL